MNHRANCFRSIPVVAGLLIASGSPAASQTLNQFVGFGDSSIDSGYYRALPSPGGGATFNSYWAAAVAAGAGKPTTSPGAMSSEALAALFGLSALPANQGGANYATSAANGVNFVPADYNAMRLAIASTPALFGFQFIGTGAGQTACTIPAGITTAWALLCSSNPAAPSHLVTPDADQTRLFADDQHLTTAGQKILADYEYSLLVAPMEISFLAEAPVKTRAAIVDSIFNQIAIS